MEYISHGGRCCGISHIVGFSVDNVKYNDTQLKQILSTHDSNQPKRLCEVVLNDRQNTADNRKMLEKNGFVLVSHFHNSNSGHHCFVYHRSKSREFEQFHAIEKAQKIKDLPAEVHVTQTFYTAHFRDGSRGALCESLDAARERFPRATRYCRFVIRSDGTSAYLDGVEQAAVPVRG